MHGVIYRPLQEEELGDAVEVFLTALHDLARRNGLPAPAFTAASTAPVYQHIFRTGLFLVAELDGRLGAISHAVVRGRQWFLSGFWALPGLQRRGVGGPLLRRTWEEGQQRGADVFFTWSSVDAAAMTAYLKLGMLPGYQILTLSGPAVPPEVSPRYIPEPLSRATALDLDREVRGVDREEDHVFFGAAPASAFQVTVDGRVVGYFYCSRGVIGPAAWSQPEHGEALLGLALRQASQQSKEVRLMAPGINHRAIRTALQAGLRVLGFSHFLTTASFGHLERYLPSGPSLF